VFYIYCHKKEWQLSHVDVLCQVRRSDLQLLPTFTPVLKAMFADEYMQMEVKTIKKKREKMQALKAANAVNSGWWSEIAFHLIV